MDSEEKKGKKGRGREGMGREFRRETARVVEGRRGTPEGHHNPLPCFITKHKLSCKTYKPFLCFFFGSFSQLLSRS